MAEPDSDTPSHHKQFSDVGFCPSSPTRQNPCKFVTRAAFFVAFAAILPLFPSQAPEFVTQTLLTRSWELLHLLLVGIAVSYGLFSRRNADPAVEKEALLHKATESPQSYLTQLLQVSPVFDDEEPPEERAGAEGGKLQMWNSRYYRGEPTVVVTPGSSGERGDVDRPLLLPVRSLRSRIPDAESPPAGKTEGQQAHAVAGVGSRALPRGRAEEEEVGEVVYVDPVEQLGDRVVHPSPIPWRSRSGRMEVKDDTIGAIKETDASSFRSASFRSQPSRPSSAASSPRRVSPSPSVSPERRAKSGEDSGKKRTLYKPPPPPPPPPPHFSHKSPNLPSNGKESKRSFQDELQGGRDDRGWNSDVDSPGSSRIHTRSRHHAESYSPGRSVRTVRAKEVLPDAAAERAATRQLDSNYFLAATATGGISPSPAAPSRVHQSQKKNGYEENVVVSSDESDSSDDDGEGSDVDKLPSAASVAEAEENEVDKKADEFIAKFREQIRLQRIETIKRSAGQRSPGT